MSGHAGDPTAPFRRKSYNCALTPAKALSRIADHYTTWRDVFSNDTPRLYNYRYPLRADSTSLDMGRISYNEDENNPSSEGGELAERIEGKLSTGRAITRNRRLTLPSTDSQDSTIKAKTRNVPIRKQSAAVIAKPAGALANQELRRILRPCAAIHATMSFTCWRHRPSHPVGDICRLLGG